MKALCWHGKHDIRYETVPDPKIEDPRDAIIKVSSCAICGSDLHLFDGFMPGMESGDIVGHEFMGEAEAMPAPVVEPRQWPLYSVSAPSMWPVHGR